MFADSSLAARIDRAEARLCAAVAEPQGGLVQPVGQGLAVLARAGSPVNKVIGVALGEPLDEVAMAGVEATWRARGENVRVELSTLAAPEAATWLTGRGYRLLGFENVLGLSIAGARARESDVVVEVTEEVAEWTRVAVDGFMTPDASSTAVESFPRAILEETFLDFTRAPGFRRYVARLDGEIAGVATVRLEGGLAQLSGATTLPRFRRRGVQAALFARRLVDAAAAGCDVAVVTTSPGTSSMANSMRQGFALLYARVVLVKDGG